MFVITKASTIECTAKVENQCKEVGHAKYDYEVQLSTDEKLDSRGFVIDHSDIHNIVKDVIQAEMASCS